jgi:hypothetical protein
MIIKIKPGRTVKMNGITYTVKGTELNGISSGVSVRAKIILESRELETIHLEFDVWTPAIDEKDLQGLVSLLTTG